MPAAEIPGFQAASDLQIIPSSRGRKCVIGLGQWIGGFSWAFCHSLASRTALLPISIAERLKFSKMREFRAVHKHQQSHGNRSIVTPDGGRQVIPGVLEIAILNESNLEGSTGSVSGSVSQTLLVN